jgi:hypothetical protein
LFCDNLDSQVQPTFLDALKSVDCCRFLLPSGETEMCQPIDGGIGAIIKMLLQQEQDMWLEEDGNLQVWEGDIDAPYSLTASARRVLITKWVGAAWETLTTEDAYAETFRKCFERTGALITADGTRDEYIRPMKGLTYTIPPPEPVVAAEEGAQQHQDIVAQQQDALVAAADMDDGDENHEEDVEVFDEEEGGVIPVLEENAADNSADDEEKSWTRVVAAAGRLDEPMTPLLGESVLPKRVLQKNSHILVYWNDEWELARIHRGFEDGRYNFYLFDSSEEWEQAVLNRENHGRLNVVSDCRWVYLEKI